MGDEIEGFRVVAACLKNLGVTHMFGVVGIPVVEVGLRSHLGHDVLWHRHIRKYKTPRISGIKATS